MAQLAGNSQAQDIPLLPLKGHTPLRDCAVGPVASGLELSGMKDAANPRAAVFASP
jgi:hypothetical protein